MEPRILDFVPEWTMNDRAAAPRKAARPVRGDDETADDPTCAYHAITNIFEEGRKAMDGVVCEMIHITDGMAATDAKEGPGDAQKRRLVLLWVLRAHLPVLEVRRPPLLQVVRHRRGVSA
eukprot:3510259-Pleurochrysis_carterae.AAC.1